jgi:cold shock CspA family protein
MTSQLVHRGVVTVWKINEGYGFIRPQNPTLGHCGRDLFAHVSDCHLGNIPDIGAQVEFVVVEGRDGLPKASGVTCV